MPGTVLIVDDSLHIRRCVREFLDEHAGVHSFEEAADGREAIAKAESAQPNVIILDLYMPVMTGMEAAPRLKRVAPNSRIILFTLFDFAAASAPKENIDATVSKVDGLNKLAAQVQTFLENKNGPDSSSHPATPPSSGKP